MSQRSPTVMLVAGEASGDRYAADLFRDLQKRMPGVSAFGMGGENMKSAGVDIRYDSTEIAVIGVGEAIKHYREIKHALALMKQLACQRRPDLLICVDYKEFNFRLARTAKACGVKVLFYVSPQVWAWRPKRVTKYGEAVDMMAVIFPFEVDFYAAHNIPVRYVGHPLVGQVYPSMGKEQAFQSFGLEAGKAVIGMFPGSRDNEIKRLLPLMLEIAVDLRSRHENIQLVVSQANSVSDEALSHYLNSIKMDVISIKGQLYDAMQCCDAIMIASGTATLEAALMGIPMVITYKLTPISYLIGRLLIKIPFIGLPNILAGQQIVQEFVQHDAKPKTILLELERILTDQSYRKTMVSALNQIRNKLGTAKGTTKLAELAAEMLSA